MFDWSQCELIKGVNKMCGHGDQNVKCTYSDSAISFPEIYPKQVIVSEQRYMCKDIHHRWFIIETMAYTQKQSQFSLAMDCLGELRRVRTPIYSHCDSVEIHTDTSTPTPGVADCSCLPGIVPSLVRVQENPSVPGEQRWLAVTELQKNSRRGVTNESTGVVLGWRDFKLARLSLVRHFGYHLHVLLVTFGISSFQCSISKRPTTLSIFPYVYLPPVYPPR